MIKCVVFFSVSLATVDRLPHLIDAVKGNRIIKRGGREMPRALHEAIESHRAIINIMEKSYEEEDERFTSVVTRIQSLPNGHRLTAEEVAFIRENARQSDKIQSEINEAVSKALKVHRKLATLCSKDFLMESHSKLLEQRAKLNQMNLERMISTFTTENVAGYTKYRYAAKLTVVAGISEALASARLEYADWFYPKIRNWSIARKVSSARAGYSHSMARIEEADRFEIRACQAMVNVGLIHLDGIKKREQGKQYMGDNDSMNAAVLALLLQQMSQWYWRMDTAHLRIVFKSLSDDLSMSSQQFRKWKIACEANELVNKAEDEKRLLGVRDLELTHSVHQAEDFLSIVKLKTRLMENVLAKRRHHRQKTRSFLASFS